MEEFLKTKLKKWIFKFLFLFFSASFFAGLNGAQAECAYELFRDPDLQQGFALSSPNTRPRDQWCEMPLGPNPVWETAEIATNTYFCDNLPQPKSLGPALFQSLHGFKEFYLYSTGRVRLVLDSSKEEQNGCYITNNRDPLTHWVTYGFTQQFDPIVSFTDFTNLNFSVDIKLNQADLLNGCPDMPESEENARFGVAFLLEHKDGVLGNPRSIWIHGVPCNTHDLGTQGCDPWPERLTADQFGIVIYHPKQARFPVLQQGVWKNYFFDFKVVAEEMVALYNQSNPPISLDDYNLKHYIVHWEIWGGYYTDIEMRNLTMIGRTTSNCPADTTAPANPTGLSVN